MDATLDIVAETFYSLTMSHDSINTPEGAMSAARPSFGTSIKVLDNAIIDQIAAGEVVDRPAHMVKELCENALDAGATEISVDFKSGGREVLVQDNGRGIARSELQLSLARHATSKISVTDDLWKIATYGFRGEALASIGAVSELRIISRPVSQPIGAQVKNHFGEVHPVQDVGSESGTTIIVKNLFQNVPARLKFLKTDAGESTAIKTQLKALALANPQVGFRVLQNGELLYYWPSVQTFQARVQQVLEQNEMYWGEAQFDGYKAQVVVSSPNNTVGHSRQIWLFVRGRHVQDRSLQAAVMEAYRSLLMHGEYPIAVVYVDCNPENIDVNVSPTKSQVKFREPSQAFRVVQKAVRSTLEKAPWLEGLLGQNGDSPAQAGPEVGFSETSGSGTLTKPEEGLNLGFSAPEMQRVQYRSKSVGETSAVTPPFSLEQTRELLRQVDAKSPIPTHLATGEVFSEASDTSSSRAMWSSLEIIGQSHLTYIIAQKEGAILFIDQHAAHERVMFEKLMSHYKSHQVEVQNFLLPPVVKLSEDVVAEMLKYQNELESLGLYIDQIGPEEIAVRGAPAMVKPESLPPMLEKLAHEYLEKGGSFHFENTVAHMVATMACHSAIRAGQALSLSEMRALLVQMDEFPLSSFCPHGRPVYVEYPLRKLERDFGRIV